ncbi:MAG TPA: hypothetical protein VN765_16065 [Candidatus Acidoferrum sp.]|nr:hypothetical protein [Candidatus Acidoferrum sp.]
MTNPTLFSRPAMLILTSAMLAVSTTFAASIDDPVIYSDNQTAGSTIQDRDPGFKPVYLVYADKQRSADEAKKLVDDLGLTKHIQDYKARDFVVGPATGNAYDDAADLTAFQNFLKAHRQAPGVAVALSRRMRNV